MGAKHLQDAKNLFGETVKQLTEHREDEIYERLAQLHVGLDEDPLLFGPKRLQEKIYGVRKALDVAEVIYLGASQRQFAASQDFRAKKVAFELAKKYLYATDTDVRAGRSQSDRDALASIKLREEFGALNLAEAILQELDAVISVIKAKRADLKNTQSVLREQHKLCYARIERGETWGSAVPGAKAITAGKVFADDVNVHNLIAQVDGEVDVPAFEEVKETPKADPEPEPLPPKVADIPKKEFALLNVPDAELDDIGDWLNELEAQDKPKAPKTASVEEAPEPTDNSGVDLPDASEEEFTFEEEEAVDFDQVLASVEAPQTTRGKRPGVSAVADDVDMDALLDIFGGP